jgi:tetratricopeptide (TPR) repeat protein
MSFVPGDSGELAKPHLKAALAVADRLPAREALLVRALSARVEGRTDEALRIYEQLLAGAPEDAELLSAASDLYWQLRDWASAARYLEKLVAVEPDADDPLGNLIDALGRSNRADALRALLARLETQGPRRARAVVEANAWLGQHDAAVRAARRAAEQRGDSELDTLRYALQAAGEFVEMESVARREAAARPIPVVRYHVDMALAAQGRVTEARRWTEETAKLLVNSEYGAIMHRQAMIEAATGDSLRVWRCAAKAFALEPRYSADLAVPLMLLGDAPHAEELARGLVPGSAAEEQYRALRAWRSGDAASAAASLARAEALDPWPNDGIAPAYLLAEVSASIGDDVGTLAAIGRFQRLPADRIWRAWAYPRALYLAATAHRRLGDREAARREVGRLIGLLSHADPTVSLLKQARSLQARL